MSGLTFTEDAARHLARVYLTPDVVAQRSETMKQLALSPGERVLDVGCGPGFLCESIVARVCAILSCLNISERSPDKRSGIRD